VRWLQAEAGAVPFAKKVEATKQQKFTKSEFQRLVNAYEMQLRLSAAGKEEDKKAAAPDKGEKPLTKRESSRGLLGRRRSSMSSTGGEFICDGVLSCLCACVGADGDCSCSMSSTPGVCV
jgi:hypothetical protein